MSDELQSALVRVKRELQAARNEGQKAQLRRTIRDLPWAGLVVDDRARFVVVNAAASELTGYSQNELLRLSVPDVTGNDDQAHVEPLWQAFNEQGHQVGHYNIATKDGTIVPVEYAATANIVPGFHLSLLRRL